MLIDDAKYLTIAQLKSCLEQLPDTNLIAVNRVGNLTIYDPDRAYVAFIDFLFNGKIEYPTHG